MLFLFSALLLFSQNSYAQKLRILVVDDVPGEREWAKEQISKSSLDQREWEIMEAWDQFSAIEMLDKMTFDIVMTDMVMDTESSGYYVCAEAKEKNVRLIVLRSSKVDTATKNNVLRLNKTYAKQFNSVQWLLKDIYEILVAEDPPKRGLEAITQGREKLITAARDTLRQDLFSEAKKAYEEKNYEKALEYSMRDKRAKYVLDLGYKKIDEFTDEVGLEVLQKVLQLREEAIKKRYQEKYDTEAGIHKESERLLREAAVLSEKVLLRGEFFSDSEFSKKSYMRREEAWQVNVELAEILFVQGESIESIIKLCQQALEIGINQAELYTNMGNYYRAHGISARDQEEKVELLNTAKDYYEKAQVVHDNYGARSKKNLRPSRAIAMALLNLSIAETGEDRQSQVDRGEISRSFGHKNIITEPMDFLMEGYEDITFEQVASSNRGRLEVLTVNAVLNHRIGLHEQAAKLANSAVLVARDSNLEDLSILLIHRIAIHSFLEIAQYDNAQEAIVSVVRSIVESQQRDNYRLVELELMAKVWENREHIKDFPADVPEEYRYSSSELLTTVLEGYETLAKTRSDSVFQYQYSIVLCKVARAQTEKYEKEHEGLEKMPKKAFQDVYVKYSTARVMLENIRGSDASRIYVNDLAVADIYHASGDFCLRAGRLKEASEDIERVYQIYLEHQEYLLSLARMMANFGNAFLTQKDYDHAKKFLDLSATTYKAYEKKKYEELDTASLSQGAYLKETRSVEEALSSIEEIGWFERAKGPVGSKRRKICDVFTIRRK